MHNKDLGNFGLMSLVYVLEIQVKVVGENDGLDFYLYFYLLCKHDKGIGLCALSFNIYDLDRGTGSDPFKPVSSYFYIFLM